VQDQAQGRAIAEAYANRKRAYSQQTMATQGSAQSGGFQQGGSSPSTSFTSQSTRQSSGSGWSYGGAAQRQQGSTQSYGPAGSSYTMTGGTQASAQSGGGKPNLSVRYH
jgi:hypothetical protein